MKLKGCSSAMSTSVDHVDCLATLFNRDIVREIKGNGITEEWYAAVLLMCATHFHFRAPCGPETFLLFPLMASC